MTRCSKIGLHSPGIDVQPQIVSFSFVASDGRTRISASSCIEPLSSVATQLERTLT